MVIGHTACFKNSVDAARALPMLRRVLAVLPPAASTTRRCFSDFLPDLIITNAATKQLNALNRNAENKQYLRVAVEGGGCSGFQYVVTLEDAPIGKMTMHVNFTYPGVAEDEDRVFEKDGAQVVVDETSMELLKGSTVDFAQELIRSSFTIINNPNASSGCGCGSSFELKE
ncbi:Aste57867_16949 [Aphanomyces stellatus]|uniref:Aste57867_16949 protein n=1 Tax=Aphanomyces stellatus TaxID=120398 RepID=A0A485L7K0_9STRA|nr:hypothetical protein As57867_016891 [Aphanomyces stellatus]VFT93711.1 Aste57867_16949 [Aphanomyces stellatus]